MKKLSLDLCFNYSSLVLLACSGVLINFIIVSVYGTAELGHFSLVYAVFILLSQFSALGVHYSVLRNLAVATSKDEDNEIACSGLIIVIATSCCFGVIVYFSSFFFQYYLGSSLAGLAARCIAIALPFFSINKVLLAILNAKRYMRLFALGQGLRYLLMLSYVGIIGLINPEAEYLFYVFSFSECLLSVILLKVVWSFVLNDSFSISKKWLFNHLYFGLKGFFTGVFAAMNARVTLIMLSFFVSSSQVGIYSFAAMVAEGLGMVLTVVRNQVNPVISILLSQKRYHELDKFMLKVKNYTYLGMAVVTLVVFISYIILIEYFLDSSQLKTSWSVLLILSLCIFSLSGYLPFLDYLTQANRPQHQSIQNLMVILVNLCLGSALIPLWGVNGAALSAGVSSYIISLLMISWFVNRQGASFFYLAHKIGRL